ncbi:TolC family outer membrane protein [Roseateles sp. DAIF2]|uniref:TolC family outer membrane protein n=1 Tax=Roseateles sp. DAIF2 TaxID=2714952 RepID=UPI0018A2643D|nr:TolC family outer membrane protein [Roseateles sp. DAIF2]QPF74847.1 TolC family outer membrane protein [Roseateles sp. DAIF2]
MAADESGRALEASLLVTSPGLQRLQIEAPVGGLAQMSLMAQGQALRIDLRRQPRAEVEALVQRLRQEIGLVRGVRAVYLPQDEAYVWVDLVSAFELIDQTIVAARAGRSRWELVLGQSQPSKAAAVELRELRLAARDDLLDIHLSGSAELMAEVSVLEQPARLVVELPGTSPASVERLAAGFRAGPVPLFARVSAGNQGGVPRLEFQLLDEVDLVDSAGEVRDGQGRIRLSLAADRAVAQARVGAAAEAQLERIEASLDKQRLELALPGVPAARLQSYALEEPARLVVDLLGWRPEQVHEAAARFVSPHPGIAGLRVETTRLGSARLVFDLSGKAPLLARGAAGDARYALSLRLPAEAGSLASAQPAARGATSYAQRGERLDPRAPLLVVRPLMLSRDPETPPLATSERNTALLAVYREALERDPKYQAARADYEIAAQAVPQARAGLLPTASIDYQKSAIRQEVDRASNPSFPTGASRYPSSNLSLTITQPLLRAPALFKYNQAGISVEQARFNLLAAEQDLILRVASGMLNVMAGNDGLDLARAERQATERQYELAKARKTSGLGNVTQLFDAEARHSQARAREREAGNRLEDARLAVKEIIGEDLPALGGFKGDFTPTEPMPAEAGPWVNAAVEQNLALQARRLAVQISELEIKRQKAGYAPSVNLVASTSRQDTGGSLFGRGQRYNNAEVGLRVNIPLFEGGMTHSLVREANARRDKAQNEQEQELRRSERLARGAFNGVLASLDSVDALRKAVLAQQSALEAREEGLKSGLFTPVQVMDAYRLFYTAKRDFLQARYDYLLNRLKLKQAVGILSQHDLDDLSALLQPL